jgi:hypothetical protein
MSSPRGVMDDNNMIEATLKAVWRLSTILPTVILAGFGIYVLEMFLRA